MIYAEKKFAFEDQGSTTGFLLPLAILRNHNLTAVRLKNYRDPVPPGKVGFVFAGDEINITTWVERMHVHAGAYSNQDWEGRGRSPRSMQKNLMLLFKSRPMVRSLFVARHGVQPLLKNAVKNLLLAMNNMAAVWKMPLHEELLIVCPLPIRLSPTPTKTGLADEF